MSSCAAYMEKHFKANLLLENLTLEEIASIKKHLETIRKGSAER